jgi:hypothetical protein
MEEHTTIPSFHDDDDGEEIIAISAAENGYSQIFWSYEI